MIKREDKLFDTPRPKDILWKYMDIYAFIHLIQNDELVFTKISSMEDKFEGVLPDKLKEQLRKDELADKLRHNKLSSLGLAYDNFRNMGFINCWIISNCERVHMWKIYSKQTGIAIKTTYEKIKESLNNDTKTIIYPTKIKYIDYTIDNYDPKRNLMVPLKYKNQEYQDENEVRLIFSPSSALHYQKKIEKLDSNIRFLSHEHYELNKKFETVSCKIKTKELINEIYLSPYAPSWYVGIINDLLEKYGLNPLKIQQSNL